MGLLNVGSKPARGGWTLASKRGLDIKMQPT